MAKFSKIWQTEAKFSAFLAILIFFALFLPLIGVTNEDFRTYANVVFAVLIIAGISLAWHYKKLLIPGVVVGFVSITMRFLAQSVPGPKLQLWADASSLAAILVIALILLIQVFGPGRVGPARIQAAIAAYMLIGAAFAHAYHLTAMLHPGSFNIPGTASNPTDWMYYSFSTLMTVGYGDITAVRPVARTLSVFEALTGQFYMAVLIARLVALAVIHSRVTDSGPRPSEFDE